MMNINGVNITSFGNCRVLDVIYGASTTTYEKDWLKQSKSYLFNDMYTTYSTVQIKLLVKGTSRVILKKTVSNIVNAARHSLITFDDRAFGIDGTLNNVSEDSINGLVEILTLELEGMKVSNTTTTLSVSNGTTFKGDGNLPCGFVMTITPTAAITTLTFILNGETFTFSGLAANTTYTLDTVKGTFTSGGTNCFTKFTGWELPYILGGVSNLVTLSASPAISITYRGRWS